MSKRKVPNKPRTGYVVMVRYQDPTGSERLEPYNGIVYTAIWDAQEDKWLADHDGNVYGAYIKEVEIPCGPTLKC